MADPTVDAQGFAGYVAAAVGSLAAAFTGWRMMKKDASNSAVSEASNEANIEAINTYKELVATERAARKTAEERADKFAEERNSAMKDLYTALGRIESMSDQIMNLNAEVKLLREEVAMLRQVKATT